MLDIHTLIRTITTLQEQADTTRQWLSITLPLSGLSPGISAHSLPQLAEERYFWARPDAGEYWLGIGSAWEHQTQGENHLSELAEASQNIFSELRHITPERPLQPPRFSIAAEQQTGRINLPAIQILQQNGTTSLTVSIDPQHPGVWQDLLARSLAALQKPVEPQPGQPRFSLQEQNPNASVWLDLAEAAIEQLRQDQIQKLVLTRQVRLQAQRELSAAHLLQTLLYQQSRCTLFALDRADGCWVGASPEVLLDKTDDILFSEAVAGTIRRDACETVDRKLGEWLLKDHKNSHEHRLVVDSLCEGLAPVCSQIEAPAQPQLLKLRGLQHLYTPITASLGESMHPLQLADQLHPSPAINGYPRMEAKTWLQRHEPLDRRLFTGLVGWIDTAENAALNVVLRCACIQGDQVELFAGAGLVADSDALAEWEETELKLDNMTRALQEA